MKVLLSIISFLIMFSQCYADKVDINSLLDQLKNANQSNRISLLNDISVYYFIIDDSLNFTKYGNIALEEAKRNNNKIQEVDALNYLSYIYSYRDKKMELFFATKSLELAQQLKYEGGIAFAYFNLAFGTPKREFSKKIEFYQNAIRFGNKAKNSEIIAISNTYLGDIYSRNDNYSEAIKCMITAQKIFDKLNISKSSLLLRYIYGELLGYMGLTYKRSNNLFEAEKYYKLYKDNSKKIGNFYGEAFTINNLGIIYYNQNKYNEATNCFMEAIKIWENHGITTYLGNIYCNLGEINTKIKDYEKVEYYFQLALKFSRFNHDIDLEANILINIADYRIKRNRFTESKLLYEKAKKLFINISNNNKINVLKGLAEVYDSLRDYKTSYKYFKLSTELRDSISIISHSDEMALMTERYQNEKILDEQKKNVLLKEKIETEKQQRKNNLEYLAIVIFLLIFFALVFFLGKYKISTTKIETFVFIALVLLFEFIQLLFDPYINKLTNGEPVLNLILNVLIALSLTPIDTYSEKILRKKSNSAEIIK